MKGVLVLLAAFWVAMSVASADSLSTPNVQQIALTPQVVPPGGTPSNGADGWAVHGTIDGIAYRYGSGSHFLQVANSSGQDWRDLNVQNAWLVRCYVATPGDSRSCWILLMHGADPSGQKLAGLQIRNRTLCFPSEIMIRRAEIAIDTAAPIALPKPDFCLKDAVADALLQKMLAGQVVHLKGFFANETPVVDLQLETAGLRQALSLRDWILAQYAAGKLQLTAP
jgi:hypothetical protein